MNDLLFLDFETRSACDLKKSGADVYSKHPTTDVLCVGLAVDDGKVSVAPVGHFKPHLRHTKIVSHNAAFELAIWNNVCVPKYGWPTVGPENFICTMAMAYAMALPGSLEKASAAVGITQQKDMVGHRVMMQLSQPRDMVCSMCKNVGCLYCKTHTEPIWWDDEEKFQKLYEYCRTDVEVERELYKRLMKLSPEEKIIWDLDQKINNRGVTVDVKAIHKAISVVEFEKKRLDQKMRELTANQVASTAAVKQLTDWITEQNIKVNGVAKADVLELLADETLPPNVREALLCRQEAAKSSNAKLKAMLDCVGSDGRVRGMFQYHGATTGRWAGRKIQFQNLPRPKLKQSDIDKVFEILS